MVRREILIWLKAAEEDIVDAEIAYEKQRWFRTAFFSQQAVEKALKALFFVVRREEPPKLHSVTELYKMLKEKGFSLPKELENQVYIFNKYYTVTRYPDAANGLPSESIDKIEAERALNLAKKVLEVARKHIEKHNKNS